MSEIQRWTVRAPRDAHRADGRGGWMMASDVLAALAARAATIADLHLLFYRIKRRASKPDTMGTGIETLASHGLRIIEATGYKPNITREDDDGTIGQVQ